MYVQILAELSLSAILRRLPANGNLTHLKAVSIFSIVHISKTWLICWFSSKVFADALFDYIYSPCVTIFILDDRSGVLDEFGDCSERFLHSELS